MSKPDSPKVIPPYQAPDGSLLGRVITPTGIVLTSRPAVASLSLNEVLNAPTQLTKVR